MSNYSHKKFACLVSSHCTSQGKTTSILEATLNKVGVLLQLTRGVILQCHSQDSCPVSGPNDVEGFQQFSNVLGVRAAKTEGEAVQILLAKRAQ